MGKLEADQNLRLAALVMQQRGQINELEAENRKLREELESYRRDEVHIIDLREDAFVIQHPLACRPDLFGCPYNRAALRVDQHPVGRYRVSMEDGELIIEEDL